MEAAQRTSKPPLLLQIPDVLAGRLRVRLRPPRVTGQKAGLCLPFRCFLSQQALRGAQLCGLRSLGAAAPQTSHLMAFESTSIPGRQEGLLFIGGLEAVAPWLGSHPLPTCSLSPGPLWGPTLLTLDPDTYPHSSGDPGPALCLSSHGPVLHADPKLTSSHPVWHPTTQATAQILPRLPHSGLGHLLRKPPGALGDPPLWTSSLQPSASSLRPTHPHCPATTWPPSTWGCDR